MNIQIFYDSITIQRAILGFSGWSDAGNMVQQILAALRRTFPSELVASWDLEGFWHTDSTRPQILIQHGQIQRLDWPGYDFFVITLPSGQLALLGTGMEPSFHWKVFTHELLQQLKQWGCEEILLLGSLYDQVYYDEVVISGVVQDSRGLNQILDLGLRQIEYEGPCAIHSSIMESAPLMNIRCLCLWSHLPFYLKCPHELIMAHYLRVVGALLGVQMDVSHLMERWEQRLKEIEELINENQELVQLIQSIKNKDRKPKTASDPFSKVVSLDEFLKKRNHPSVDED
jgi:proteasome assembly chaperone (PAC2) family protein